MKATGILWKNLPGQKLQKGIWTKTMRLSIRNFCWIHRPEKRRSWLPESFLPTAFTVMTKKSAE